MFLICDYTIILGLPCSLLFPDEHENFFTFYVPYSQVHDEREFDRVLAIEGIELIGINNRNLGMSYHSSLCLPFHFFLFDEMVSDLSVFQIKSF